MHNHYAYRQGFTIVELLIVIVVIAILAAISIVAFTGIQERAIVSTVKSDLSNFAKRMEVVRVDSDDGLYPERGGLIQSMDFKATKSAYMPNRSNWIYCPSPDRTDYALGVLDSKNKGYYLTGSGGIKEDVVYGGAQTCDEVGSSTGDSTLYQRGYTWNSGTNSGTWHDWVN